jgi:hypothetical protein
MRFDSSLPQTGQLIVLGILPSSQAINSSSVENSAPQPVQLIILPFVIQKIAFRPWSLSMLSLDGIFKYDHVRLGASKDIGPGSFRSSMTGQNIKASGDVLENDGFGLDILRTT